MFAPLMLFSLAGTALSAEDAAPPVEPAAAAPATLVTVPALTPVYLRIDTELSSKKNRNGDRFPIHIDEDVRVGDVIVIPAGSAGEGEVIHAAKSGAGGKAGELLIAARFVSVGGQEVKLRSLSLGAAGKDRTAASLATSIGIGPLALFVVGVVVTIPKDTVAAAKTAMDLQLPPAPPSRAPAEPQSADSTTR